MESVFLNGTGRHVVRSTGRLTNVGILGNFLYWLNNKKETVIRADKVIGANPVVLATLDFSAMDLKVFSQERQNCKFSNPYISTNVVQEKPKSIHGNAERQSGK